MQNIKDDEKAPGLFPCNKETEERNSAYDEMRWQERLWFWEQEREEQERAEQERERSLRYKLSKLIDWLTIDCKVARAVCHIAKCAQAIFINNQHKPK